MNKNLEVISIIFYIIFVIVSIILIVNIASDGGKCVVNPLRYYEEKSNYSVICGCYKSEDQSILNKPITYSTLINITNLRP